MGWEPVGEAARSETPSPASDDEAAWEGAVQRRPGRAGLAVGVGVAIVVSGMIVSGLGGWRPDAGGADDEGDEAPIPVTEDEAPPEGDEDSPFGGGEADAAPDGEGEIEEEADDQDGADPEGFRRTPALGSWRELPEAPVPGRSAALGVWTGDEALFWGGRSGHLLRDGAAYDPGEDAWRPISGSPRAWDPQDAAVWTGEEMVVLGSDRPFAYDLRADAWREIAEPPPGAWAWEAAGSAEGRIVAPSHGRDDRVGDAGAVIAYDPAADAWVDLPNPPLDAWVGTSTAWLDGRLVLMGTTEGSGWDRSSVTVLDPGTETWTEPEAAPVAGRWVPSLAADSRSQRVLAMGGGPPMPVWEWSPAGGWREAPDIPAAPLEGWPTLIDTGDELLLWEEASSQAAALLGDAEWALMAGHELSDEFAGTPVWTGEELVVWGDRPGSEGNEGAALRFELPQVVAEPPEGPHELGGRWRWVPHPGFARVSPSLDAAGEEMLLWGGVDGRPVSDGASYDPDEDAWRHMPDAPVAGRMFHTSAWTGEELLVWGGVGTDEPRDDGAAYDPVRRQWREIPAAPVEPHGPPVGAWTGDELVVVTGTDEAWDAAAYDPAADEWRRLPDPPGDGRRNMAVWTGEEILVVSDGEQAAVVRYDVGQDAWALASDSPAPLAPDHTQAAWAGEELLVWSRQSHPFAAGGWAYDPAGDTWRTLSEPWLRGGPPPSRSSAWSGEVWLVAGATDEEGPPGLAAYEPASDRWLTLPPPPPGAANLTGPIAWTGTEFLVWTMLGDTLAFRPE